MRLLLLSALSVQVTLVPKLLVPRAHRPLGAAGLCATDPLWRRFGCRTARPSLSAPPRILISLGARGSGPTRSEMRWYFFHGNEAQHPNAFLIGGLLSSMSDFSLCRGRWRRGVEEKVEGKAFRDGSDDCPRRSLGQEMSHKHQGPKTFLLACPVFKRGKEPILKNQKIS